MSTKASDYHVAKNRQKFERVIRAACCEIELSSFGRLVDEGMLIRGHKVSVTGLEDGILRRFELTYGQTQESNDLPANWGSIFSKTTRFNSMFAGFSVLFGLSGVSTWNVPVVVIFKTLCFIDGMMSPIHE